MTLDKRGAILQAALQLFAERGLYDAPVSLIAKQSGASAGTIYHYFADKDDLIHAVYMAVKHDYKQAVAEGVTSDLPHNEAFRRAWLNAYRFYISHEIEARFLEHYENSPYFHPGVPDEVLRRAESAEAESVPVLFRLLLNRNGQRQPKDFPFDVLYALTFGVAIHIAKNQRAGLKRLDDTQLEAIANLCYEMVMK
ncbi:MAG TPA: TetR/AcrR family transcriptional regulator [Aggregatilinea sp.]|uniref:TetR/AcrR family transcriptional regulator n=1 Tax=Aggregatilinea sp. TaxID=2806333 RepID=UPI002BBBFD4B|nr:TetR/AcrR family transcriptional regulator [Aggregatilinea sp.]HML21556.1 TetR/AcrR family transcriptional regulator [Aggregatilinea sp.]